MLNKITVPPGNGNFVLSVRYQKCSVPPLTGPMAAAASLIKDETLSSILGDCFATLALTLMTGSSDSL